MKLQLARALTWMLAVDLGLDLLLEDLQLVVSRLDLQLDYMHLDLLFMEQQVIQQLASKLEGRLCTLSDSTNRRGTCEDRPGRVRVRDVK